MSAFTGGDEPKKTIQLKPLLECGGGLPIILNYRVSGQGKQEFQPPTQTVVSVLPGQGDANYCLERMEVDLKQKKVEDLAEKLFEEKTEPLKLPPKIEKPPYRMEGLAFGVCLMCTFLILIDQLRADQHDQFLHAVAANMDY